MVENGLELARDAGERGYEAWGLYVVGGIRAQAGDLTGALAAFQDALRLAEELGMRPLQAQCRLALGQVSASGVRTDSADAEIAAAREMFDDMQMSSWLEKTDTASSKSS
jgi:hypothetical protein